MTDASQYEPDILPLLLEDVLPNGGGLLVMLKAYMDRAAKQDASDAVMCVACVMFRPVAYSQFVRDWDRMLKPWGASAFHARDFYPGAKTFKRDTADKELLYLESSRRIPEIIATSMTRIMVVSFRPSEFLQVAADRWKDFGGNGLHSLATQICLLINGDWIKETPELSNESFAYFMESGDESERDVVSAVAGLRKHKKTSEHIKVASFSTVDKGNARGLEAADCVAWHWNKYYMDTERTKGARPPRRDFISLVTAKQGKCKVIFATGDDLQYLFSLVPENLQLR